MQTNTVFRRALLASSISLICASVMSAQAAELTGRVVDSRQVLLSGVQVSIPALKISKVTGHDGRFVFSNLPEGQYQLQFSYAGVPQQKSDVNPVSYTHLTLPTKA